MCSANDACISAGVCSASPPPRRRLTAVWPPLRRRSPPRRCLAVASPPPRRVAASPSAASCLAAACRLPAALPPLCRRFAAALRGLAVLGCAFLPKAAFRRLACARSAQVVAGRPAGGEAFPPALVRPLSACCGGGLWNAYGPTETTIWSALRPLEPRAAAAWAEAPVPIGGPLPRTSLLVVAAEAGGELAGDGAGELLIGGVGVARGYRHLPELTRSRFVPWEAALGVPISVVGVALCVLSACLPSGPC